MPLLFVRLSGMVHKVDSPAASAPSACATVPTGIVIVLRCPGVIACRICRLRLYVCHNSRADYPSTQDSRIAYIWSLAFSAFNRPPPRPFPHPANANRSRSRRLAAALTPAAFLLGIRIGSARSAASIANKANQLSCHSLPSQADVPGIAALYDRLDVRPAPKVCQYNPVFCVCQSNRQPIPHRLQ